MVPALSGELAASLYMKMKGAARVGAGPDWNANAHSGEINLPTWRKLSRQNGELTVAEKVGVPFYILRGATLGIWELSWGKTRGEIDQATFRRHLEEKALKRNKRSKESTQVVEIDEDEILRSEPSSASRIAIRDIARTDDTRTVIPSCIPERCLLTPEVRHLSFTGHPNWSSRGGRGADGSVFILGVLSTMVVDWYARTFVELHVTGSILENLPVPNLFSSHPVRQKIEQVTGSLIVLTERTYPLPDQHPDHNHDPSGEDPDNINDLAHLSEARKEVCRLEVKLDALVAQAFGLNEAEVAHIYDNFHPIQDHSERKRLVLVEFAGLDC